MARLTGMDVSNASMYDGATATAEAMIMCIHAARKKNTVLISDTFAPNTLRVVETYANFHDVNLEHIPAIHAAKAPQKAGVGGLESDRKPSPKPASQKKRSEFPPVPAKDYQRPLSPSDDQQPTREPNLVQSQYNHPLPKVNNLALRGG